MSRFRAAVAAICRPGQGWHGTAVPGTCVQARIRFGSWTVGWENFDRRRGYSHGASHDGTVTYLRNSRNGAHIYLVGTAHISAKSAEEVRQVIEQVNPDSIAVELCEARAKEMQSGGREPKSILQLIGEVASSPGGFGQKLIELSIKSLYLVFRNADLEPGQEFRVAIEEAQRRGTQLHFIDRDVHDTAKRLWEVLSWRELSQLFRRKKVDELPRWAVRVTESDNFVDALEKIKTREIVRQLMKDMEENAPNVVRIMVYERDKIMVKRLREIEGTVVGVVGMAHMDGIERLWKDAEGSSESNSMRCNSADPNLMHSLLFAASVTLMVHKERYIPCAAIRHNA